MENYIIRNLNDITYLSELIPPLRTGAGLIRANNLLILSVFVSYALIKGGL